MTVASEEQTRKRPAGESSGGHSANEEHENAYRHLDTTLEETLSSLRWLAMEKKEEYQALVELLGAEVNVAKKSALVSILATLAAFVFCCFCWLVINLFITVGLHKLDMHFAPIALIVFSLNAIFAGFGFAVARDTYRRISLMPACRILMSAIGFGSTKGD